MAEITIEKIDINGDGVGILNGRPILIYGALPGDRVEYRITESKPSFQRGKVVRMVKRSSARRHPACGLAGLCDSCPLMAGEYANQLEWKLTDLRSLLARVPGLDLSLIEPVITNPNELGYRNLCKLPVIESAGGIKNAMYRRGSNHPVVIEDCLIHEPGLEKVRKAVLEILNEQGIRAYQRERRLGLRFIYLRGIGGKYQLGLSGGMDNYRAETIDGLMRIPGMNSIYQAIQTAHEAREPLGKQLIHLAGTKGLSFRSNGIHLTLSLPSFYQMNTAQAERLYSLACGMAGGHYHNAVEAYCGIGAMSLMIRGRCDQVTGIEFAGSSIRDANEALKRNPAANVRFIEGDAAAKLTLLSKKAPIDLLIADPPRSGLGPEMVKAIEKSRIPEIIYVSCNPLTLAEDLKQLPRYHAARICPLDIFSETAHLETVVKLERKG